MKSILFIMPAMLGGGAEKVLIDILRHWDFSEDNVSLLIERKDGTYINDIPTEVKTVYVPKWVRAIKRASKYISFFDKVYSLVLNHCVVKSNYDSIVSFMEGEAVKLHSYISEKAKKNVSWVHIDFSSKHWSSVFFKNDNEEKACYEKMDKIVFVSDQAKAGFEKTFDVPAEKIVQYNLIDAIDIKRKGSETVIAKDGFTICMAGRLNRQKRYDRALEAASILKGKGLNFRLWIVGDGELGPDLKLKEKELGIEDYVTFWGFQKPPYPFMASADMFLNTSESEGYPLTLCEAICLGKPVAATNVSGAKEILGDNEYGVVVEEDINEIAAALEKMMTDPATLIHYRSKAEEKAEYFRPESVMTQIYSIL